MFTFFKSKPILTEFIPDNYIDIHSHILPGIDDGAKTFEDTLFLINSLKKIGVKQFITTPHIIKHVWNNTSEIILNKKDEITQKLNQSNITVPFRAAAEYLMDIDFVNLFENNKLLTLKDDYVLVEMSYINPPIQLYSIIFQLKLAGYIPVLAHPERYLFYHNNFEEYKKLKNAGCLFQLNLLATVGYYGIGVTKTADKLLQAEMYDFVGSDVHHKNHIAAFNEKVKIKEQKAFEKVIANNSFFSIE